MKQNWWLSIFKQNHFVFKLGISILFVGFGFRLLFSESSTLISDNRVDSPVVKKDLGPINPRFVEPPKESVGIKPKDDKSETCDLFNGQWVPSPTGPSYTNNTCRWIENHQNCMMNGRPDTGYLYWRWSPRGCDLPRFDAKRFLEMMRGKTWTFIGDSITRNHLQSFICLMSQVEDAVEIYHDKDYKDRKWHFPSYNVTVNVFWSPFIAKAETFEDINGVSSSEIKVHLDVLDTTWRQHFQTSDYVVFSSGKWFIKTAIYYENDTALGCHYCHGKNYTDLGFDFAYRRILNNLFDFVFNSRHKGMIFFRTSTPDHFEDGEWSDGGTCNRTEPAKDGDFEMKELNRILRGVEMAEYKRAEGRAAEEGVRLRFLDVTALSLMRPDGHPGPYRHFYPFATDKNVKVQYDCLHWCLPGPIDAWNDLMMEVVAKG